MPDSTAGILWDFWNLARCSDTVLMGQMRHVLAACIRANLPFPEQLYEENYDKFIGGSEELYALAAQYNPTAATSIEHALQRPAFRIGGHRVYVGKWFEWEGEHVKCTRITKTHILACSYLNYEEKRARIVLKELDNQKVKQGEHVTQVKKRYKLTHEDLKRWRKPHVYETVR